MQKSITRMAALAVFTVAALCAQGPHGDRGQNAGGGNMGGGNMGGGGAGFGGVTSTTTAAQVDTIVAHQVTFLTSMLTLTTAQAAQATSLFTAELNAIVTLQGTIATAQTALGAAVKANNTTAITTQATAIGAAHGQIVALQAKADAAFYALLTTAQQTTLNTLDSDFFTDLRLPGGGH